MTYCCEPLPRLVTLSNNQRKFDDRPVYRVTNRNGRRQLVFLPAVVLKFARGRTHRDLIRKEAAASAAACAHPFWQNLATPALRLGPLGMVRRRYRPVALEAFDAVSAVVDAQLEAAMAYPRQPMSAGLEERALFAALSIATRTRLRKGLRDAVPATSMHGDLHFFNFVRGRDGYRLLDWEHFEANGSFAYDFLEFHMSVTCFNSGKRWVDVLTRVDAEHPAVQRLAALLDADPAALLAYFLFLKVDTIFARQGGAPMHGDAEATALRNAVEAAAARLDTPVSVSLSA